MSLEQDHHQSPNNLNFYSVLYFHESRQLRLFSTSQPSIVWRKASTQSCVTSSSSSIGLLSFSRASLSLSLSAGVEILSGLHNLPDAHAILVVTPLAYVLHVDTPPIEHTTHTTYSALLLGKHLRRVSFRKEVYLPLCHQRILSNMSERVF